MLIASDSYIYLRYTVSFIIPSESGTSATIPTGPRLPLIVMVGVNVLERNDAKIPYGIIPFGRSGSLLGKVRQRWTEDTKIKDTLGL